MILTGIGLSAWRASASSVLEDFFDMGEPGSVVADFTVSQQIYI